MCHKTEVRQRMKKLAGLLAPLAAAAVITLTGGCALLSPDELYSLPQPSEEYVVLQELIDDEIEAGCEYSAPSSGSYTQIVHTGDLDGDGSEEAVAYLRDPDGVAKICIYDSTEDGFRLALTVYGESGAIDSVEYADMNGDGCAELIAAWQGAGENRIGVYSLLDFSGTSLLSTGGTAFRVADMNGDSSYELLVLYTDGHEGSSVNMFELGASGMEQSSAKLSSGVTEVDRLRTGLLSDGVTALFAEGSGGENSIVTDIFIASETGIRNITADEQSGASTTSREYAVYATDINGDRILEVPMAVALERYDEDSPIYYIIDWYAFDSTGRRAMTMSTYHCYSDGWYISLPYGMRDGLLVRREDSVTGEHAVVLSIRDSGTGEAVDILTIYTLTGDNRNDRAELSGRFVLTELSGTIYAAKLHESSPYTEEDVKEIFDVIFTEWNSGAL